MAIAIEKIKWRTIIGLVLIYATVVLYPGYQWIWGVLLVYWVIPDLVSGTTHFIERISRSENPVLYWVIVITWLAMAAYIFVEAFLL